jgi:leucyl aminopeptidase
VLLIGLGAKDKLDNFTFSKYLQTAFNTLVKLPIKQAICCLAEVEAKNTTVAQRVEQISKTAVLANYKFDQYKSKKIDKTNLLELLTINATTQEQAATIVGQALANGMNLTRDLANLPCNVCTPAYLADQAKLLAKEFSTISVDILERDDMAKLKMNALLAVAQGSHQPPKLITLSYQGGKAGDAPTVLVGKGITFDTGGISLKPPAGMEEMKFDMSGAASVIGTIRAIAEMKLPINVVGLVPAAENMPDGNAYRPGDILTSMSGQTIEIVNTDAEGRLILCDALTYAEKFKPSTVIDIATLTGAMVMSLGYLINGVFSNQDNLAHELVAAGQTSNDLAWHMPLVEDYQEALKSNYADMINASKTAGAITAACFLARFTKNYRWAHIDCAGTAMPADTNKAAGATGRPVALLVEYLRHVCAR